MSLETLELIKTIMSTAILILLFVTWMSWFIDTESGGSVDGAFTVFIISFMSLVICVCLYIPIRSAVHEKQIDYYYTCVSNDYTVYLDGTKVENPDNIEIKNYYNYTIDDDKKEIIISD